MQHLREVSEVDGPTIDSLLLIAETALDSDTFRPLGDTLDHICNYIRATLGCADVRIRILDQQSKLVQGGQAGSALAVLDDIQGLGDETLSFSIRGRRNPSVEVFTTGRPRFVLVSEFEAESAAYQRLSSGGMKSTYYSPIFRNGAVVGVLSCYWTEEHALSGADEALVTLMCRLASVSLATATIADNGNRLRLGLEDVYQRLQEDNSQLRNIHLAQSRMIQLLADGSAMTVEQTARTLSSALKRSVIVCGPDGAELALEATKDHVPFLRDAAKRHCAESIKNKKTIPADAPYTVVRIGGSGNGSTLGVLILAPRIEDDEEFNQVVARQAALVIGTHIQAREADAAIFTLALPAALLSISRGLYSASQLKEVSALLGLNRESPTSVALVHTATPEAAFRLSRKRAAFSAAGWPVLTAVADGNDVLVLLRGGPIDNKCAAAITTLHPEAEYVGFSSALTGLDEVGRGLKEAHMSVSIAASTGAVAYYDDFGSFVEITGSMSVEQMTAFVRSVLGDLRSYDERRNSGLVDTLRAYVENDGQALEVAATLSIHVNTLHKRLHRIEELSGINLRSFRDVSRVTLALDLMPTIEGVIDWSGNK
ncbi:MAG TPA: helix-turn-helix domain-containing protein [Microbacteriaceae bacterium]